MTPRLTSTVNLLGQTSFEVFESESNILTSGQFLKTNCHEEVWYLWLAVTKKYYIIQWNNSIQKNQQ